MIEPTGMLRWRKARRCNTGACVEVARDGEQILVRDSKAPQAEPLKFTREEWDHFLAGAREGDFDF
jgi:alpha-mannosidase